MNNTVPATQPTNNLPLFRYDSPKIGRQQFGVITVGGLFFHKVNNLNDFCAALGCSKDNLQKGFLPDELIWERYTRAGAPMSQHCLQVQIANYLYGHSDKFTDLYGPAYALMLGDCLGPFNGSDKHCKNCPMHPGFCDSVTNEELDELIFIADNLRTDESHRFFGNVANHLLMKGLIEKFGTSVRVTPHGRAKIGLAINGGDTKQANRTDGSSND